ncbi:MAG TPA: Ig-like domain-containing protein [Haliangiales bacterium]|nr:Ig-like domain-containing protein [Haliangiales bacterium]
MAWRKSADGRPLSARIARAPAHGTIVVGADGSLVYAPGPSYAGRDSFTYVATDGVMDSAAATVTIAGEAPPTATVPAAPVVPVAEGEPAAADGCSVGGGAGGGAAGIVLALAALLRRRRRARSGCSRHTPRRS